MSIAIQAKSEIVQGSENVKVVIAEVNKSLGEMDRHTVRNFRSGKIDTQALLRMFGDMESEDDLSSEFDEMKLSSQLRDVIIDVKNTINFGTDTIVLCQIGNQAWVNEDQSLKMVRIDIHGKQKKKIKISATPQNMSRSKTGDIHMCFYDSGWISRLTTDHRVKDIVNTKPLHPLSVCITQSGDILVVLVDVSMKDYDKCRQTYIARLDSLGREKQGSSLRRTGRRDFSNILFM